MTANFNVAGTVEKYSRIPLCNLRIVENFADLGISKISKGIVFVFAVWSGPAVMALRNLTRLLANANVESIEFVVLDNDCMTYDQMIQLCGHVFHGSGETLWIRDGRVVSEASAYKVDSETLILKYTHELLHETTA